MLLAAGASGAPKPALFPAQEGNYWIFKSALGDQKIIRCEPGTNNLVQVTGLSDRPAKFYASPKSSMLYELDPGIRVVLPSPVPAGVGSIYKWRKPGLRRVVALRPFKQGQAVFSTGDHYCDLVLAKLAPVTVPIRLALGEYTDCSVLEISSTDQPIFTPCDLLLEKVYFAPGVGPVLLQGRLDRVYRLVEAQVDGVLIGGQ